MSQQLPRTDAHCHLFNIFFLVNEMAEVLWDKLWGNYPHRKKAFGAAAEAVSLSEIEGWIANLIEQIEQISHAAFGSCEENFQLLTKAYQQSFGTDEKLIVYPLMMDIYYMFAAPPSHVAAPAAVAAEDTVTDPATEFDRLFGKLKEAVIQRRKATLPDHLQAVRAFGAPLPLDDVEHQLEEIRAGIVAGLAPGFKAPVADGVELSKGFEKQVWDLMDLRKAHPDCVFPFFAVDPRRIGVMDMITKGTHFLPDGTPLVGGNGPFFGLKLYPRLGYLPMDVETLCPGLYQWCCDRDLPITVHCSKSGFPEFPDWPYESYGDPQHWHPVLGNYADLRIDFAHFGHNGDGWAQEIITLMGRDHNRVYTDIACYDEADDLKAVKTLLDANSILQERLLFGTDFDVMLLTDFITLQQYFDQCDPAKTGIFSVGDMEAMARTTPPAFLNGRRAAVERGAGAAVRPHRVDRQARDAFVKELEGKNRFGWVRDLPDIRDYSMHQDTLSKRHRDKGVQMSVKEMVLPLLSRARKQTVASVDLSPWCSPVEDQGDIGACTAHAAIALVEYFEIRTQQKYIDASRLFLYKVSRNLLNWTGDTGAYLRTAMEALVLFGVPPEQYMPYVTADFDAEPSAFCYAFGQSFQTASYYRLDPAGTKPDPLLADIKASLVAGYPLMFGFTVYDSMGEAKERGGKVPFPSKQDHSVGGHAVAAVGYDDTIVIRNTDPGSVPSKGAIKIKNSWGTGWGDKGYGWLPYDYVLKGLAVDWWTIIKQEWVNLEDFQ